MIVDPDFADHWKSRMLVGLLGGDEAAPVYVLRLWAHCQNRRKDTFDNITQEALKSLCRFPGHSNKLESSLLASGFIRRDGETLIVCGWSEYNASLVASWSNGRKGGRPKVCNPRVSKHKPTGSREEKRREEKKLSTNVDSSPPTPIANDFGLEVPPKFNTNEFVSAWQEFCAMRVEMRSRKPRPVPWSDRAARAILSKLADHDQAIAIASLKDSVGNGWQGVFPEKMASSSSTGKSFRPSVDPNSFPE